MVKSTILTVIATAMAVVPATAFVTSPTHIQSCSALEMSNSPNNKMSVTAAIAGACLLTTVFTADIANAVENAQIDFGPSSTIIAGRGGGGRGGGRAMGGGGGRRMGGGGASYARPPTQVRNVSRTTYISRPSVVVSPFGYGGGYGYSPFGGFGGLGLGYGLGAAGNIGNEIRDNRQEGEIQNGRVELELAKQKAAQLEQRLQLLEQAQGGPPALQVVPAQVAPVQVAPAVTQ